MDLAIHGKTMPCMTLNFQAGVRLYDRISGKKVQEFGKGKDVFQDSVECFHWSFENKLDFRRKMCNKMHKGAFNQQA